MAEFTGERVIPDEVDADLWNEHYARYLFASRLASGQRALDMGCGVGYGSKLLAETASTVTGVDISPDAVQRAREHYSRPNLTFLETSCTATGLPDSSFDLIVAFEVIEHLANWPDLLREVSRLLAPSGLFVVSTPNKAYYAESRKLAGPNPFHEHEFEIAEFDQALKAHFPSVSMFVQNHAAAVLFQPVAACGPAEVRIESRSVDLDTAHFFVAVCSRAAQTGPPGYAYVPSAANVLRERELHIEKLESSLRDLHRELEELNQKHRALKGELEKSNQWAQSLDGQLAKTQDRVVGLQEELETAQAWAASIDAELKKSVQLYEATEQTMIERTEWALRLQAEKERLEELLAAVRSSGWYLLGRRLGLGPEVRQS